MEMQRTQKNKATSYHLGRLKAQLAKLRTELLAPAAGAATGAKAGDGFEVSKYGHARVGARSQRPAQLPSPLPHAEAHRAGCASAHRLPVRRQVHHALPAHWHSL